MREYAFTKWLKPLSSEGEKEEGMIYNELMGLFHVQGDEVFRKCTIDTQHTVSLLMLKGELSLQMPEGRMAIQAPAYIEFIEPHQWTDLKTDHYPPGTLPASGRMYPTEGYTLHLPVCTSALPYAKGRRHRPYPCPVRYPAAHPCTDRKQFSA